MIALLLDRWRRRYWRPQAGHDAFDDQRPMVVVTGGSAGLGTEIARVAAGAGHHVLLVARNASKLDRVRNSLAAEFDVHIDSCALDLALPTAADELEKALQERGAYADILVNNAGIGLSGPFDSHEASAVAELCDLNVRGASLLMHKFLPGMVLRGRGGVLNIASLGGYAPGPHQAAYYASKAYLISLSEAAAAETTGQGVRLSVVAPGPIHTGFHRSMGAEASYYLRLLPTMKPHNVAKSAWRAYMWGQRVIIPGIVNRILALSMRLTPHPIVVPIVGWLLKRRNQKD